jgi:hypothetical protein
MKSELDIFTVPPTQTSIESGNWIEYNPIATLTDGNPIEFVVSGSGQDYIDPACTQLYVKAKITNANDSDLANDAQVGPVNLFLQSLFTEVDVSLNETSITSSNNTYAYRAYIETLLSYGQNSKQSQLTSQLYYKDTAGGMEAVNPHADDCPNGGFKTRSTFTNRSRVVDMLGGLHCDIFFQDKYLLNDVGMRIRLMRSGDAFCLMSANEATFKVKILDCKLFVRKVKISPSVFLAHAKALENGNAKYPIRRCICKTYTIPTGNLDHSQESLFTGQLPTRIVVGLVDNDAYNGRRAKNPFNFKPYGLRQLKLYLDGQQHSLIPVEPNFETNNFITAYAGLFAGTGKLTKDEGIDVERSDFGSGYALYAFDLTSDLSEDDHFNLVKHGSVRLDLKFGAALANTVNVIAYAEFETILEIDKSRNVIIDYKN